ncbi:MAG: folate-binding protein YgfZ [Betaproteobacteria bacterium]
MDTFPNAPGPAVFAPLTQYGLLAVSGEDARAFLHAQLSNDVEHLSAGTARRAGYCSPKGRLLASLMVVPHPDGFLLQVAADIAPAIAKRLSMYVLRSKVKVTDAASSWSQFGVWGGGATDLLRSTGFETPNASMQVAESAQGIVVTLAEERCLVLAPATAEAVLAARFPRVDPQAWALGDVRAGLPLITLPTQDQFVPQMANFEVIGGIDFKKGCYPGQEIVARTQYLGKLKRRMYRGAIDAPGSLVPAPGQDLYGAEPQPIGMIVNVASLPEGGFEMLAVLQSSAVEAGTPIRVGAADGPSARMMPLPYAI